MTRVRCVELMEEQKLKRMIEGYETHWDENEDVVLCSGRYYPLSRWRRL